MSAKIDALTSPEPKVFNKSYDSIHNFVEAFPLIVNPEFADSPKKRKFQVCFLFNLPFLYDYYY
jgi:hypothetical protein